MRDAHRGGAPTSRRGPVAALPLQNVGMQPVVITFNVQFSFQNYARGVYNSSSCGNMTVNRVDSWAPQCCHPHAHPDAQKWASPINKGTTLFAGSQ